jgi:hypothetical protein
MALVAPPKAIEVHATAAHRQAERGTETLRFQAVVAPDSGIVLYDPHGYWSNFSLKGMKSLVLWLNQWIAYQAAAYKPQGYKLVNTSDGTEHTVADGMSVKLLGDSFIILKADGEPSELGALPAELWEIMPIYAAAAPATT